MIAALVTIALIAGVQTHDRAITAAPLSPHQPLRSQALDLYGEGPHPLHRFDGDRDGLEVQRSDEWVRFLAGYSDGGGPSAFASRFATVVLPCEAGSWEGLYGENGFYSRAQFSGDTWIKVAGELHRRGLAADADDPYVVGVAVGWWAARTDPATQWPVCWWA